MVLLVFGLVTRAAVFGDIAYFNDESFYLLAGQRMHAGAIPYVDVWDRKGPALFALWYLLAGLPGQPLAYQLAAWLAASGTALAIAAIARGFAGWQGAVLAGMVYLSALPMFGGAGGQTPVFYNLAMAGAGWGVWSARDMLARGRVTRRVVAAMAAAGLAIAFKQCAVAEAIMLGLYALARLARAGLAPGTLLARAGVLVLAGVAPFALAAGVYLAIGHWAEFWQAMVGSNLARTVDPYGDHWMRIAALANAGSPILALAAIGLAMPRRPGEPAEARAFVALWTLAAIVGVAIVPNFYDHYMLPLMVPLALASARIADRGWIGAGLAGVAMFILLVACGALERAPRREASDEVRGVAARIAARQPGALLLVYEGPMALYGRAGRPPESPLLDNFHLYFPYEDNTSHLDTGAEMARILAQRPQVVVTAEPLSAVAANPRTLAPVRAYLGHCRKWFTARFREHVSTTPIAVWGDCAR
ncbi:MAG: hypothetical protein KGM17_05710 [Sphingomonadales bacterium]|nr:hypothetical protein [Sphingomonadales bacterium]